MGKPSYDVLVDDKCIFLKNCITTTTKTVKMKKNLSEKIYLKIF